MIKAIAIGVDLGGTQVRAALVDRAGKVLGRAAAKTDATAGPAAVMDQIQELVDLATADIDRDLIVGVGVAAPGPLDSELGVALFIPTLAGFVDVPLAELVGRKLGLPVRLENDGHAAAFGEWRFGAGRGLQNLAYVTVSTGIGGGVVADGRLLRGRRGMAAHIGHMTIDPSGSVCACGNCGCWEAQASGTALAREARLQLAARTDSMLAASGKHPDAAMICGAARKGDPLAQALVAKEAELLGIGLVNLLHLYSPERVIIGGGLSNSFDLIYPGIITQIRKAAMPPFHDVPIVRSALGDDAGVIGVAALILEENAKTARQAGPHR